MYKLLLILIIILAILYTIDNKPLNIVIDFILIIINISILLFYIDIIDLSFFSFILVIIYASALAILFGLIMMLFNNVHSLWKTTNQLNIPGAFIAPNKVYLKYKEYIFPLKLSYNFVLSQPRTKNYLEFLKISNKNLIFFFLSLLSFIITFFLYIEVIPLIKDSGLFSEGFGSFGWSMIEDWSTCKADKVGINLTGFNTALEIKLGGYNHLDIIKIIFSNIYYNNYINILIIIIILLISLIGIIFLLI